MKLQNITARYGRKKVLKNINLTLENEHQIIGILGPNGAGKTTFLNVVLGRLN
ncbi:ATP-binding cassette domain-containing protein, partial [Lacticaseibacillus paracasei]|uniref:ATP-binding cassette domain-containing protein n=1 Tax=Lacticaseibacillus paracasei TaxID=1597 RepID=UPI003CF4688A